MLIRMILAPSTIAMAAGLVPAAASAQAPAAAPAAAQTLTRAQLAQKIEADFKASDTNGDGKISKAEIQAALQRRAAQATTAIHQQQQAEFNKLDTNKDGRLSLAEYQAGTAITLRPEAVDRRMQQLDTNKDNVVTPAEFRAVMLGEFDKLDTNKDGVLSAQEAGAQR